MRSSELSLGNVQTETSQLPTQRQILKKRTFLTICKEDIFPYTFLRSSLYLPYSLLTPKILKNAPMLHIHKLSFCTILKNQKSAVSLHTKFMQTRYTTIALPAEGLYKEKGSKFLAFAEPVRNIEEVKERLEYYRKEYHDARHVCYAYMLGAERTDFRANDDGEPSGTAGRPILGQINSLGLTNILVVVVRYFGGILLGTGGLIVAYKEATRDALSQAEIVERDVMEQRKIAFPYEKMNEVMRTLKACEANILSQGYEDNQCVIAYEIKLEYADRI